MSYNGSGSVGNTTWVQWNTKLPVNPPASSETRSELYNQAFDDFVKAMARFFEEGYKECLLFSPRVVYISSTPSNRVEWPYLVEFALDENKFLGAVDTVLQTLNTHKSQARTRGDQTGEIQIQLIPHDFLRGDRAVPYAVLPHVVAAGNHLASRDGARNTLFFRMLVHVDQLLQVVPLEYHLKPEVFVFGNDSAMGLFMYQMTRLEERRREKGNATPVRTGRLSKDVWMRIFDFVVADFKPAYLRRKVGECPVPIQPLGTCKKGFGSGRGELEVRVDRNGEPPFVVSDTDLSRYDDLPLVCDGMDIREPALDSYVVRIKVGYGNDPIAAGHKATFGRTWRGVYHHMFGMGAESVVACFVTWTGLRTQLGLQTFDYDPNWAVRVNNV